MPEAPDRTMGSAIAADLSPPTTAVCWVIRWRSLPAVLAFGALLAAYAGQSSGQDEIERIDLEDAKFCLWSGTELPGESIFAFQPPADAREFVNQMLRATGVPLSRIVVKTANVGNAMAVLRRRKQYILFSSSFIEDLRSQSGSDWAAKAVFAHELGHHLSQHLLNGDGDQQIEELEADSFSGTTLCRLGASLSDAQKALNFLGAEETVTHPHPAARLEAVAQGWRQAVARGDCQPGAPVDEAETLFKSDRELRIDATNIDDYLIKSQISADKIVIDGVTFAAEREVVLLSNRLELQGSARLASPRINIVTATLSGGFVDADGDEGENGGEIFIAAGSIDGTTIRATGGKGRDGEDGATGADGPPGANGRNGRCGPGMLDQFVGSTNGQAGADGQRGGDGKPGKNGGRGGNVVLLTVEDLAVVADVSGGLGGKGGAGGRGGRGGRGGQGGAGCTGLGGTQPTRPNGSNGRRGDDGSAGKDGDPGPAGSVWQQRVSSLAKIASVFDENMTTEEAILQLRQMARGQVDDDPSAAEEGGR